MDRTHCSASGWVLVVAADPDLEGIAFVAAVAEQCAHSNVAPSASRRRPSAGPP
jgi:hypothetical protein